MRGFRQTGACVETSRTLNLGTGRVPRARSFPVLEVPGETLCPAPAACPVCGGRTRPNGATSCRLAHLAVRGFLERRDGLPSQGALHALRRERPGARTIPCARAHGHAGARPSGRGPAGLRADAHGRRPGHRIVPPGRQGDRPGAAGVPVHAAHARRQAGALPARRTLASARGGRVQAARRAPARDRGPRPGERAGALAGARQTALGARGVLRPGRRRMDGRGRGRGLRHGQRPRAGLPGALPPTSRSCSTASTWSGTPTRT